MVSWVLWLVGLAAAAPPNILFVLADDVGTDQVAAYHFDEHPAKMPVLDGLAAQGMVFERTWANPVCSPTRASVLTGTHPFRHGVGGVIQPKSDTFSVSHDSWTLPKALADAGYASAAIGKWHLGTWQGRDETDPLEHGFGHFAGSLANLVQHQARDRKPQDYHDWERTVDGVRARTGAYATEQAVDDALTAIGRMPEPWFTWLAFQAGHAPFHEPPRWMWSGGPVETKRERYQAMLEAMDHELGRLLESLPPSVRANTVVVFMGDNGSPEGIVIPPLTEHTAKGSMFEGGIRVPLVVSGPGVAVGRSDALINHTDLLATFADLAGLPSDHPARAAAADSVSFAALLADPGGPGPRATVYSERFRPNGVGRWKSTWDRAIRDERFKYVRHRGAPDQLYDLGDAAVEGPNLLKERLSPEARAAKKALKQALPR